MPRSRSSSDALLSPLFEPIEKRQSFQLSNENFFADTRLIGTSPIEITVPTSDKLSETEWPIGAYGRIASDGQTSHLIKGELGVKINNQLGIQRLAEVPIEGANDLLYTLVRRDLNEYQVYKSASSGLTVIEERVLDVGITDVTFSNIPDRFTELTLEFFGFAGVSASLLPLLMRVGDSGIIDTSNDYQGGGFAINLTTGAVVPQNQNTATDIITIPNAVAPAFPTGFFESNVVIKLPNYNGANDNALDALINITVGTIPPTGTNMFQGQYSWTWLPQGFPIDIIQLTLPGGEEFGLDTVVRLLGN